MRASSAHGFFTGNLGLAVDVYWSRLVFDRVRRPSDEFAVKGILRTELNDLRAAPSRRLGQKPGSFHVHGRSFGGIPLSFVDLNHRAIDNQRWPFCGNTTSDRGRIGDIEILVFQRQQIMIGCKSLREMAAD